VDTIILLAIVSPVEKIGIGSRLVEAGSIGITVLDHIIIGTEQAPTSPSLDKPL
jgi:hypothetical protein